jgi:large subunit ribosomal protein L22
MSKQAKKSRLETNEAFAKARYVRSSARKLNLVAESIRNKPVARALIELEFSTRRIAQDVRKVLQSAIANAENNHSLDVDRLFVKEATVGRSFVLKRFHTRGRGRSAGIEKPYSNLTIVVAERDADAPKKAKKAVKKTAEAKAEKAPAKKIAAKKTKTEKSGE